MVTSKSITSVMLNFGSGAHSELLKDKPMGKHQAKPANDCEQYKVLPVEFATPAAPVAAAFRARVKVWRREHAIAEILYLGEAELRDIVVIGGSFGPVLGGAALTSSGCGSRRHMRLPYALGPPNGAVRPDG